MGLSSESFKLNAHDPTIDITQKMTQAKSAWIASSPDKTQGHRLLQGVVTKTEAGTGAISSKRWSSSV
jgi:hypothetical protein